MHEATNVNKAKVPPPQELLCPSCDGWWTWEPNQPDWNTCPYCKEEHPVEQILKAIGYRHEMQH